MDFDFSDEEVAWRDEVRAFLAEHLTPDVRADHVERRPTGLGEATRRFWRAVGDRGWNSLNWPVEYGGRDLDPIRRLILIEEFEYVGAPLWDLTVTSLAPVIMKYGTEGNRAEWLPGIRSGEVTFALGYSEPGAGSDLAALRTSARLDGEEWVVDGEKIWNTGAHTQTHEWLAVRTGDEPGHGSISILIVPIDHPGVTVTPLWTWGDHRTNSVHFDGVRVPRTNLIGEVNRGWEYIVAALDNERAALGSPGDLLALVDRLRDETVRVHRDGRPLADDPIVRHQVAELAAEVHVARMLSYRAASSLRDGGYDTVQATMVKILSTELRTRIASVGMSLFGPSGQLATGDGEAPLDGELERAYRYAPMLRFGGGTNEIMRDIVAQRGCGLPRSARR